jgi:hypothetical protein
MNSDILETKVVYRKYTVTNVGHMEKSAFVYIRIIKIVT